jgi:dihydrofolate reductase
VRLDLDFTFVTDGLASAVSQARAAAGAKDVFVMRGADVVRQCVDDGLVDELRLHVAPVILGAGTSLFSGSSRRELVQRSVRVSRAATHITYELGG